MAHTMKSLKELHSRLTPRDLEVLEELQKCQVMLTHQIERLLFTESATESAGNRACRRNLNKLYEYELVGKLDRRIGGFKAGSSAHIWYLTEPGYRILDINNPDENHKRKRFIEPSTITLRHRVTMAECYVQMKTMEQKGEISIRDIQFEPQSWRPYIHNKQATHLRADMFADIIKGDYEYLYFIEIDLATESMTDILRQCERYHDYYDYCQSHPDGDGENLFPAVLWIVPTTKRKKLFNSTLSQQYEQTHHLFCVITPEEMHDFITGGVDEAEYI